MKSARLGRGISPVEVTNIAVHGLWLLVDDREFFLPYDEFPWFRHATVSQVVNVIRFGTENLHWPDLDVDLTLDSIEHPDLYPLVSGIRSGRPARTTHLPNKLV
jgi:hypothetical protein